MATVTPYGTAVKKMADGEMDLDTGTVGVLLCTTDNGINHLDNTVEDVLLVETESSGGGYSRQTQVLSGYAVTQASNVVTWDIEDVVFSSISGTSVEIAIIYKEGANDALRDVICFVDLTGPITLTGADVTIQWNASGVFTATAS